MWRVKGRWGSTRAGFSLVLNTLGAISIQKGDYDQAESLLMKGLHIYQQTIGMEHAFVTSCSGHLGDLYAFQKRYTEAVTSYQQVLQIYEKILGPWHSSTAVVIERLGNIYFVQKQYHQAEMYYRKSV